MRTLFFAFILVATACSKKDDTKPVDPKPSEHAAAAPSAAPIASKWLATVGIELEVPGCAELQPMGDASAAVIATGGTPACPTMTLQIDRMAKDAGGSLDDTLKALATDLRKPEISRKDKTANGWIVEFKGTPPGDSAPTFYVTAIANLDGASIQCAGNAHSAADIAATSHACESMRKK